MPGSGCPSSLSQPTQELEGREGACPFPPNPAQPTRSERRAEMDLHIRPTPAPVFACSLSLTVLLTLLVCGQRPTGSAIGEMSRHDVQEPQSCQHRITFTTTASSQGRGIHVYSSSASSPSSPRLRSLHFMLSALCFLLFFSSLTWMYAERETRFVFFYPKEFCARTLLRPTLSSLPVHAKR